MGQEQGAGENPLWIQNQRRCDCNHDLVVWNKGGCMNRNTNNAPVKFMAASKVEDPLFNQFQLIIMLAKSVGMNFFKVIDVQEFSHSHGSDFDQYHDYWLFPQQPLIGSECCSCNSQRGEDAPNKSTLIYGNFN